MALSLAKEPRPVMQEAWSRPCEQETLTATVHATACGSQATRACVDAEAARELSEALAQQLA